MTETSNTTRSELVQWTRNGMFGDGKNFKGVVASCGDLPKNFARDVPALFEAYSKLSQALEKNCEVFDISQQASASQGSAIVTAGVLPDGVERMVRLDSTNKKLLLLERINKGMLPYLAHWVCEIAFSLPLMHASAKGFGFDVKSCAGTLGLFYTIDSKDGATYVTPQWYGAFWLNNQVQQCSALPVLRSVFLEIPDNIDWVDAIAAGIKDSKLAPIPDAWINV